MSLHRTTALASVVLIALPGLAAAQTVLQINSSLPEGSFAHVFLQEFEARLEAEQRARIDVQIFMGNTLGSEEDVLAGARLRHASRLALGLGGGADQPARGGVRPALSVRGPRRRADLCASPAGEMLAEGFARPPAWCWPRCGTTASVSSPTRCAPSSPPPTWRGLKIRTPTSRQRVAMFNTLGANATPLSFGEVYSALDQGVIDGQENPAQIAESARFYEVQGYMSLSNHVYLPTFLLFGEPFLAGLEPEMRETVLRVAAETAPWTFEWGERTDAEVVAALASLIAINEVDFAAFQAAAAAALRRPAVRRRDRGRHDRGHARRARHRVRGSARHGPDRNLRRGRRHAGCFGCWTASRSSWRALLLLLLNYAVFSRFVLNASVSWGEELPAHVLAALTFIGAAYLTRTNEHLGFDGGLRALRPLPRADRGRDRPGPDGRALALALAWYGGAPPTASAGGC
jgi:TRAP-type transport system periplasmic protein